MTKNLSRILRMTLALLVVLAVGAFAATETALADMQYINGEPAPASDTPPDNNGSDNGGSGGDPVATPTDSADDYTCPHRSMVNKFYTFIEDGDGTQHKLEAQCAACGEAVTTIESHQYSIGWHGGEVCYLCKHDTEGVEHTWSVRTGVCSTCLCQNEHSDEYCPINDKYYDADGNESSKTGLINYDGAEFYLNNGRLWKDLDGLQQVNDTYYYFSDGVKQRHTGFALDNSKWYYLSDGELDTSATGVYKYDGQWFLFEKGKLASDRSGPVELPTGEWYYIAAGRVLTEFTGTANWKGTLYPVENGKLIQ